LAVRRKPRKLILVGKGDGWKNAPKQGDFECWGVNDLVVERKVDMEFDMHPLDERWDPDIEEHVSAMDLTRCQIDPKHQEKLNTQIGLARTIKRCTEQNIPLMTLKHYDFAPTSIPYPVEEISRKLRSDNFTNGIDYMIAYAIYCGVFTDIDLYGINMAMGSEYEWEKPGCDFWLGMAKGRGIRVAVKSNVTLLMKPRDGMLYGYRKRQTFKEETYMPTYTLPFSTLERVVLLNSIPGQKGSYEQLKSIKNLKEALGFTKEEQTNLKFVQEGQGVHWDEKFDKPKDITLDDFSLGVIIETLKWLSDRGTLAEGHLPVYERFVGGYDGKLQSNVTISEQIIKEHEKAKGKVTV
jgi:hypothetical protein